MDIVSWLLSRAYVNKTLVGMGALKGAPAMISSIVDNLDGTHDITFSWKDNTDVTHTSVLTVKNGETPAFSSVAITGGHRLTFTTQDPTQSVSFNVMDGAKGDTGISVVASNVDDNNNLTLTLSNGNIISAGKIKAVTTVDNALSTTSANPVENKVITNALNNKVNKEMGKGLFSDEEKTKLANIEDGAQVNVLEKLIVNGQEATITDKSIALTLITSAVSNLQNYYLKTETYTKQEIEDLIGSTVGVTIEIVEQLPTEGQSNVIYFLPTETEGVYSQYIYSNNSWILIGSTTVDLSNYYTKAQVDALLTGKQNVLTIDAFPTALSNNPVASGGVYTAIAQMQPQFQFANMPTARATNLGFVYQYTGTTGTYTQNMFYRCVYDSDLGEYKWVEVIFHATVTVDSAISGTSTNPVQNKVIKEALDTKQDIMQYSTMPSAQDNLGKIVQYIGTNTANYTNGYFYKAIYDSTSDVYLWSVIKFSADMLVDNALSTTSEKPVQNKVITGAINNIQGVIPSEASDTNQLVDRNSLGTASQKNFTPYVSPDNADVPISSSVYSAITNAVYGAYHPSGSKTIAELTSDLLVFANIGNVYKITEDGVTTDLFIGGAGQTIHTGDNAVVVYGGQPNTFLFDLQSGSIDLTPYQTKVLGSAVEGATTVESALGALSINKATQAEVNDMNNILGSKNLLPFNVADIIANNTKGTWSGNTFTRNGVAFTVNDDGTVTANGTATDVAGLEFFGTTRNFKTNNFKGCILTGGLFNNVSIVAQGADSATGENTENYGDVGSGVQIGSKDYIRLYLRVGAGVTVSDVVFKPMIRLASIKDDTYEPYAKTNRQLTEDTTGLLDNTEVNGAVNMLYPNMSTHVTAGITYTLNDDNSLSVVGTPNGGSGFQYVNINASEYIGKTLKFKANPSGKYADARFYIALICRATMTSANLLRKDLQLGGSNYMDEYTFTVPNDTGVILVVFNMATDATSEINLTYEPMITVPSYKGDYVPYAKSNKELTDIIPQEADVSNKLVTANDIKTESTILTLTGTNGVTGNMQFRLTKVGRICVVQNVGVMPLGNYTSPYTTYLSADLPAGYKALYKAGIYYAQSHQSSHNDTLLAINVDETSQKMTINTIDKGFSRTGDSIYCSINFTYVLSGE